MFSSVVSLLPPNNAQKCHFDFSKFLVQNSFVFSPQQSNSCWKCDGSLVKFDMLCLSSISCLQFIIESKTNRGHWLSIELFWYHQWCYLIHWRSGSNVIKLITARKQSLGQGNVFTLVCHSVLFPDREHRTETPDRDPLDRDPHGQRPPWA